MGKIRGLNASSQSSLKISKKIDKKQQLLLNTLIKVLKPKVYITDSSNFKTLVQQLTGNGTMISKSTSTIVVPPSQPHVPLDHHHHHHQQQQQEADDHYYYAHHQLESSVDSSELQSIPHPTYYTTTSCGSGHACDDDHHDHDQDHDHDDQSLWAMINDHHHQYYGDVQYSWLSDQKMDQYHYPLLPNNHFYDDALIIQQEVCVYDYDLSGLI